MIITAGGKQALFNAAMALFGPGDEVITHTPHWPTIPEQLKLAGATPVLVPGVAREGFAIRAEAMLDRVTPRTRGIVINSPCNPTGAVIEEADLEAVAQAAARLGLWVVLDLCYEKLVYDDRPRNLPAIIARTCRDTGVLCGSASKAYAMTGWRCGWMLAAAPVVAAANAIQSHATSNVSSITQKAALAALTGSQASVASMLAEYHSRRDQLHDWLKAEPRLACHRPEGAFYLFPDITAALAACGMQTSVEFAEALLDEQRVAVTPGEAFGAPGFIRMSYAASVDQLREGSRRLLAFVRAHASTVAVR